MSWRRLPNATGTVIRCDGAGCTVESITGQVVVAYHRAWLLGTQGWGRGQLVPVGRGTARDGGTTGKDLCPKCAERDRAAVERRRKHRIAAVRARRQRQGAQP